MKNTVDIPIKFGELFMDEIGLYTDPYGRVIDQQSDQMLQVKGKTLKFPVDDTINVGRNEMVFDPLNNPTLANTLFGYYLGNRFNENGDKYIQNYCTVASNTNKDKGVVEVRIDDTIMTSGEYYKDPVKYADLIIKMNGTEGIDLGQFDSPVEEQKKKSRG